MGHELVPRARSLPPAREVAALLAKEFAFVATDAEAGEKRARELADWIERTPAAAFVGRHAEALATAKRLRALQPGDALVIEFGDDRRRTLRVAVIPGESIKFGYRDQADEDAARELVERCARALECKVVFF